MNIGGIKASLDVYVLQYSLLVEDSGEERRSILNVIVWLEKYSGLAFKQQGRFFVTDDASRERRGRRDERDVPLSSAY